MDDDLNPVLGAPLKPPEDVWAASLSAALDDAREPAELVGLVPDGGDTRDAVAPGVEPQAEDEELADPGPAAEDLSGWDAGAGQAGGRPEAAPDVDDAGWAG